MALAMTAMALIYPINNFLIHWLGWPGVTSVTAGGGALAWLQLAIFAIPMAATVWYVMSRPGVSLTMDSDHLKSIAAYIGRAAFWAVLLVGLADMVISFLRVEDLLAGVVGEQLAKDLGRSNFRGDHVHYPLIAVAMIIALFTRTIGFTWLALLCVLAEFQIVVARFIFSYEQAFMGDLVRFWYAALFLFASAYTLIHEGHVRVDLLYMSFSARGKAWTNTIGSMILGVPLCWIILIMGMWDKSNLINAPLLTYEVSQSGFGMYVKYLMAGFLLVYALTMLVQFLGYFLANAAVLLREADAREPRGHSDAELEEAAAEMAKAEAAAADNAAATGQGAR